MDSGTAVAEGANIVRDGMLIYIYAPNLEAAMSDRGVPTSTWVIVTLVAALLGSPLIIRGVEKQAAQQSAPQQSQPITVELNLRDALQGREQPAAPIQSVQTPVPVGTSLAPSVPLPATDAHDGYLQAADLVGLSRWQLDILRNEIYARHGRRFNRAEIQAYFDQQPWYRPRYAPNEFPEHLLSAMERWNVELIADYQRTH